LPVRQASQRHLSPRHVRLCLSDSLSDWNVLSIASPIDLRIAGTINGWRILTSVRGSLRIELCVALSRAGANIGPQPRVARCVRDRGGQDLSDRDCQPLGILHQLAELRQHFDLAPEQQDP